MQPKKLFPLVTILSLLFFFTLSQVALAGNSKANIEKTVNSLIKNTSGLDREVLTLAVTAYENARKQGKVRNTKLTVIDYSKPSSQKRMWIFDLTNHKLHYYTHVTHGVNSGNLKAKSFSNKSGSRQTSLGTFITADTYQGANGYSLNLHGLEHGINHNAHSRRIVVHGAPYAEPSFVKKHGRLGRSWGCPAVGHKLAKPVINTIKGGSVVFAYYPQKSWLAQSKYLNVA